MTGSQRRVAARIREKCPKAVYTHCCSHKLNLALVKAMDITAVGNMMDTADKLVRFYNFSPKRQHNLEKCIDDIQDGKTDKVKMKELCRTRWVARHDAFNVFIDLYESIVSSLQEIRNRNDGWNAQSANDAMSLYIAITQFPFIAALITTRDIMAYVQPISVSLQSKTIDIVKATDQIKNVIGALEDIREKVDTFHSKLYSNITSVGETVGVLPAQPRTCGRQRNRANAPAEDGKEYFKRNITIPMLDQLLMALHSRFGNEQHGVTRAFYLVPSVLQHAADGVASENIREFLNEYRGDMPSPDNMDAELRCLKRRWKLDDDTELPTNAASALKAADKSFFPNIHTPLKLLCTLGVTSCECERSISALKRLKMYLRSTMLEDRMNGLAMLHIHYGRKLDEDAIITMFAQKHPRRMELINIVS